MSRSDLLADRRKSVVQAESRSLLTSGYNRYDPYSQTASIVAGTLNSLSAGILLYTGFVELLAHDFIFNKEMAEEVRFTLFLSFLLVVSGMLTFDPTCVGFEYESGVRCVSDSIIFCPCWAES